MSTQEQDRMTGVATMRFTVQDVTGTSVADVEDVQSSTPAGDVAMALAEELGLISDDTTPWALRENRSARMLIDDRPIGDQIEPGTSVTVTPKGHLG